MEDEIEIGREFVLELDARLTAFEGLIGDLLYRQFPEHELRAMADDAAQIAVERTIATPIPPLVPARAFIHRERLLREALAKWAATARR